MKFVFFVIISGFLMGCAPDTKKDDGKNVTIDLTPPPGDKNEPPPPPPPPPLYQKSK